MCFNGLREVAGVGVGKLLAHGGVGEQCGRCDHPSDAQSGAQHFTQAAAVREPVAAAGGVVA